MFTTILGLQFWLTEKHFKDGKVGDGDTSTIYKLHVALYPRKAKVGIVIHPDICHTFVFTFVTLPKPPPFCTANKQQRAFSFEAVID